MLLSPSLCMVCSRSNMYVADTNTVTTVNYTDWRTISGSRVHAVIVLVTEAILVGESMVKVRVFTEYVLCREE